MGLIRALFDVICGAVFVFDTIVIVAAFRPHVGAEVRAKQQQNNQLLSRGLVSTRVAKP